MHFRFMTFMVTPWHKTPCPGGHETYNFSRLFIGHHNIILNLSDLCLGLKKKIFKEIMHFHYMTYIITSHGLAQKPVPGVMKFII